MLLHVAPKMIFHEVSLSCRSTFVLLPVCPVNSSQNEQNEHTSTWFFLRKCDNFCCLSKADNIGRELTCTGQVFMKIELCSRLSSQTVCCTTAKPVGPLRMFALRSAVVLTYLVVATGRRHADSLGQLNPEDVAKAEEKTAEVLESLTPHGGDGKMIPIEASFQVASTMGDMPVKTKMTLLMSHVSTASDSETPSLVCQLTAKNEVAASNFAKSLKEYWDAKVAFLGMAPPVTCPCQGCKAFNYMNIVKFWHLTKKYKRHRDIKRQCIIIMQNKSE